MAKPTFWDICRQLHIGVFEVERRGLEVGVSSLILMRLIFDRPIGRDDAEMICLLSDLGTFPSCEEMAIPLLAEGAVS
jgi:hypothetical protein